VPFLRTGHMDEDALRDVYLELCKSTSGLVKKLDS
jgi:hypothetical protein